MKKHLSPATFALAIACGLSFSAPARAQEVAYIAPVEMKGQVLRGSIAVAQHENDGMIGVNGKGGEAGYKVDTVTAGWPAASAGILPGDIIASVDGTSVKGLESSEALKMISQKKEGEVANIVLFRNGEAKTIAVTVGVRKRLLAGDAQWQKERTLPPAVSQMIFGESVQWWSAWANRNVFPMTFSSYPPFLARMRLLLSLMILSSLFLMEQVDSSGMFRSTRLSTASN